MYLIKHFIYYSLLIRNYYKYFLFKLPVLFGRRWKICTYCRIYLCLCKRSRLNWNLLGWSISLLGKIQSLCYYFLHFSDHFLCFSGKTNVHSCHNLFYYGLNYVWNIDRWACYPYLSSCSEIQWATSTISSSRIYQI
jgi:hypothetical protein